MTSDGGALLAGAGMAETTLEGAREAAELLRLTSSRSSICLSRSLASSSSFGPLTILRSLMLPVRPDLEIPGAPKPFQTVAHAFEEPPAVHGA